MLGDAYTVYTVEKDITFPSHKDASPDSATAHTTHKD